MEYTTAKITEDGRIYARHEFTDGRVVVEKADPHFQHNAPRTVTGGTEVNIRFRLMDFDDAERYDSQGILNLDVEGTAVSLDITDGVATLVLELFTDVTVRQLAPYYSDARVSSFAIEVT